MKYILNDFEYQTYWAKIANNLLIRKLLPNDLPSSIKEALMELQKGTEVPCIINEQIQLSSFDLASENVEQQYRLILNFLLMTGYLGWSPPIV